MHTNIGEFKTKFNETDAHLIIIVFVRGPKDSENSFSIA